MIDNTKIIDLVTVQYLDETEIFLGDEISKFEHLFHTVSYVRYKQQRKHIENNLKDFESAISLLSDNANYWIETYNSLITYFNFYCAMHDKEINK